MDCCLGFLAAWALKGGLRGADEVLDRFPSGPLLLFHAWVALSAVIAVGRNIWQSASELSLRGLAYNVWLTRGISWHDDYYPLQDPFFYSVALAMLFSTWALLSQGGDRLLKRLVGVVLAGAATNVVFALWQKATGMGWVNGQLVIKRERVLARSAFIRRLHGDGPVSGLRIPCEPLLRIPSRRLCVGLATLAAAVGLYLSGSRSTLFFVFLAADRLGTLDRRSSCAGGVAPFHLVAAIAVVAAVHWTLDHGYRGHQLRHL